MKIDATGSTAEPEQAESLPSDLEGKSWLILEFINKDPDYFFERCKKFHKKIAMELLESVADGSSSDTIEEFLLLHLDRFTGLDKEVALMFFNFHNFDELRKQLIEYVFAHPEHFFGFALDKELAIYLLNQHMYHFELAGDSLLIAHIDRFTGLDKEIALLLVRQKEKKSVEYVLTHPEYFFGFSLDKEVVLGLLGNKLSFSKGKLLLKFFDHFNNLDRDVALAILKNTTGTEQMNCAEFILSHPEHFAGLTFDQEFLLLIHGLGKEMDVLCDYIDKFSGLDREAAINCLWRGGKKLVTYVFSHPDHFTGFALDKKLALEITCRFEYLEPFVDNFLGLDKDVAMNWLGWRSQRDDYNKTYAEYVLSHPERFAGFVLDANVGDLAISYDDIICRTEKVTQRIFKFLGHLAGVKLSKDLAKKFINNHDTLQYVLDHPEQFGGLDKEWAFELIKKSRVKISNGKEEGIDGAEYVLSHPELFNGFSFNSELALALLADDIGAIALAKHIDKFIGLSKDVALGLSKYRSYRVGFKWQDLIIAHVDSFVGLDQEIAVALISDFIDNKKEGEKYFAYLFLNPQHFGGLGKSMAMKLLADRRSDLLLKYIDNFTELDKEVALGLLRTRKEGTLYVLSHPEHFSGFVFDKEVALILAEVGEGVAHITEDQLAQFVGLDREVAEGWLSVRTSLPLAEYSISHSERFVGFKLDKKTADIAFSAGHWQLVRKYIDQFSDLDQQTAEKFFKHGDDEVARYVLAHPDNFVGLNLNRELALVLLDTKHAGALSDFIPQFTGLDHGIAIKLFETKKAIENTIKNADCFSDFVLGESTAQVLLDLGQPELLIKYMSQFTDLNAKYLHLDQPFREYFLSILSSGQIPVLTQEDYHCQEEYHYIPKEIDDTEDEGGGAMRENFLEEIFQANRVAAFNHTKDLKLPSKQLFSVAHTYNSKDDFEIYKMLMTNGYLVKDILEYSWVLKNKEIATFPSEDKFPCDKPRGAQESWLARHAFHIPEGWQTKRLGSIIYNRLHTGIDTNLHDATYWLKDFDVPGSAHGTTYKDENAELLLLLSTMDTPEKMRARLPSNPNRYRELFASSAGELVYQALLPLAKEGPVAIEQLKSSMRDILSQLDSSEDQQRQLKIPLPNLLEEVENLLTNLAARAEEEHNDIPGLLQHLKIVSQNRTRYIDEAQTWVQTHQSTPRSLLQVAWTNRPLALSDGCADNPRAIKQWADINTLKFSVAEMEKNGRLPKNFSISDVKAYTPWLNELVRCYSGETAVQTVALLKEEFNPEYYIPPAKIDLDHGWVGEVLPKNDPRGFTIGYDTGCCMTLGGASESCIHAGYTDPSYGFFVLYRDGRLCAQSFLYTNTGKSPGTIICDNIEANEGRDQEEVLRRYQEFFRKYIRQELQRDPSSPFVEINVGIGYTEVGLDSLESADQIPMPLKEGEHIYSDASVQKKLFKLDNEEIEKIKAEHAAAPKKRPRLQKFENAQPIEHLKPKTFVDYPVPEQAPILAEIEAATYPENQRRGITFFQEELAQSVGKNLLVIEQREGNEIPVGYALVKEIDSPDSGKVIQISEIAIVADAQKQGFGKALLGSILAGNRRGPSNFIDFHIRDQTFFNALRRNEKLITEQGFHVMSDTIQGDEHLLRLKRNIRPATGEVDDE